MTGRGRGPRQALSRLRAEHRQRRQHEPFRIAEPAWDGAERARLRDLVEQVDTALGDGPAGSGPVLDDRSAVAEAATNLWRARKRISRSKVETRDGRQIGRYLRATQDALDRAGVAIQDHDGDPFHPGHALEVVAFQEEPDLSAEVVLETVRPTVYLGEECIQMGQVIVGHPSGPANPVANPVGDPVGPGNQARAEGQS